MTAQLNASPLEGIAALSGELAVATSMLVAVDALAPSRSVAEVVTAIACSTKTAARILAVVPSTGTGPADAQRSKWAGDSTDAHRRAVVHGMGAVGPAAAQWPVTIRAGDAVTVIAEAVAEWGAGLLVMGLPEQHRDSSLRDNVVKRVLRRVNVPTLLVAPMAYRQPQTVVVGVDFTPSSLQAARSAARLIAPGGTLYLAHVGPGFHGSERKRPDVENAYSHVIDGAFSRLRLDLSTPANVRVQQVQLDGLPYEQLLAFASEVQAELIAVGSHRLDRMGSIGRLPVALLRDASRSVLIAPPRGA